jgi:hypothetical protein
VETVEVAEGSYEIRLAVADPLAAHPQKLA